MPRTERRQQARGSCAHGRGARLSAAVNDRALDKIAATIRRRRLLRARDSVLVAVSGGPDSVALLAALVELGEKRWRLAVAHVNHHLRGRDSERDQRFVIRLAERLGCPVYVCEVPVGGRANLEARARELRYRALVHLARAKNLRLIATGHTLDDQAETVLFRVLRGSGRSGLGGIQPARGDGVVRPLIDTSRIELREFLRARGLRHRVDRSNESDRFTRNRLRRRVLPLLSREIRSGVAAALARLADISRDEEVILDRAETRAAKRLIGARGLDGSGLRRIAVGLQRRVLRRWLATVRGNVRDVDFGHVEKLRELAVGGRDGQQLSLPGGRVTLEADVLRWNRPHASRRALERRLRLGEAAEVGDWRIHLRALAKSISPGPWRAVFDAAGVATETIRVRGPRPGDRIRPLGLGGSKKLQDLFIDAKVPRAARASWPVVVDGEGAILWVPGLARSDAAPVRPATRRRLVIDCHRAGTRAKSCVAAEIPMCYRRS